MLPQQQQQLQAALIQHSYSQPYLNLEEVANERENKLSSSLSKLSTHRKVSEENLLSFHEQVTHSARNKFAMETQHHDVNVSGTNLVRIQLGEGGGGGVNYKKALLQHQQVSQFVCLFNLI